MPEGAVAGSLARRLVIGAAVGVVLVVLVITVLLRSSAGVSAAQRAAARSAAVLGDAARTERLVVDLETGLRGYLITGQRSFLAPYTEATRLAPAAVQQLEDDADLAIQRRRARAVAGLIEDYQRDYAQPLLAPGKFPRTAREEVAVTTEGKRRLDALRGALESYSAVERRRLTDRSQAAERRGDRAVLVDSLALGALVALILAFALLVHRAVVRPVRRVGQAVERIREGDLEVRVDRDGPREIAALGEAIGELAGSLAESRDRLEDNAAELRRLGERNLVLLDNVFAQTPSGLAFLDRDLRYVRVNAAMAAMNGVSVAAHLGRRVDEVLPGLEPRLRTALDHVLGTGEAVSDIEVRGRTPADPSTDHEWSVTYYPVHEDGVLSGVGAVIVDITQRKRVEAERERAYAAEREARQLAEAARSRAAFLADATAVLDETLGLEETLRNVADLCVPRVADWCAVDVLEPGGAIRSVAVAHQDPARLEMARDLRERYPPDPAEPGGAASVIRSGEGVLYRDIPRELLLAGAKDAEHLSLIDSLGMVSAMIVPLTARGHTFGAITFVAAESARHFGDDDFALAQDLAARCALALDNARLYRERSHVARTLQASLLPEVLPEIPGISIAARYEPLGAASEVGGDFYDVFPTGDGRWAVVIGDVCGKGAEAAALTALARYTLRAVAPLSPVEALRHLNAAILRQRDDLRFITLIYAELDLNGARPRLTISSGGHPPALLVHAEGAGEVLTCAGTLIGVTPEPRLRECSFELRGGDTVALYTDGVLESSHAEPLDADALLASLGDERSADDVADRLQRLARAGGADAARDDVAILALQVA